MATQFFQLTITGDAYLQVKQGALTIYTQSRLFHVDNTGTIVTAENYPLVPQITIPLPHSEPIAISETGAVTALVGSTWQPQGQIMPVLFISPLALQHLVNGYYAETISSGTPMSGIPGSGGPFTNVKTYYISVGNRKQRPLAVLEVPPVLGDFIIKAQMIVQDMTNNAGGYFVNVTPALPTVTTDIDNLATAETIAKTKRTGAAAARDLKYNIVLRDLQGLQLYVQSLADNALSPTQAIAIINSSGLGLKEQTARTRNTLRAVNSKTAGTILLTAKAVKDAGAYEWEMSTDTVNWTRLTTTLQANTKASGLTSGNIVFFQCRAITKTGAAGWSQSVSIVVM